MKLAILLVAGAMTAVAAAAHAERPDCGLFPDMHSRFACYDNVSRAPNPDPAESAKPNAARTKAAVTRSRKARTSQVPIQ